MSESEGSQEEEAINNFDSSSPPLPPFDETVQLDESSGESAPPPLDSSSSPPPNPPSDLTPLTPEASPPPPDLDILPIPSIFSPTIDTPPPAVESPPTDSSNSPAPPESTTSPSPPSPVDSEKPPAPPNESHTSHPAPPNESHNSHPAPPNESHSSHPAPEGQSHPPPSSSTNPEEPSAESPPSPPSESMNSPPAQQSDPTESPPIQQSGPALPSPDFPNAPPSPFPTAPPRPNGASNVPVVSPSLTVPSKETPPTNVSNANGQQGRIIAGAVLAGFAIIAVFAIVFLVRRKKKKSFDRTQYLPHPNFSVKSDGLLYGQDPSKVYSGPGGSLMYNSQQHSSMGNSYGSQTPNQYQTNGMPESTILGSGQTLFNYEQLAEITQGFASQNILGEGGFGCVYKGTLQDGKLVAVKELKAGSGQGDREFMAEIEIISRVHHRHLVSLVGYCISNQHKLLIYEFVSNQTLEHHLHDMGKPVLDWSKRVRIAIGSAKGLAYLHEDCHPKIIHRDIKSANILLDDEYEAQVADFGLARLNDTTQTHVSTRVMGTFGYLAPEYASSGKLTDRSDVFSFGVVLLELVTGRKPVDQDQPLGDESLVEWARPLLLKAIETRDFSELIDKRLENQYVEHEVFRMIETAAACVRHSGPKRPRMAQVVRALDSDGDLGDISNGIKVGQSTAYDSGQYNQDIMKFRKMAFGSDDNTDSGVYSGDYSVKNSSDFSGNESETRPFNNRRF